MPLREFALILAILFFVIALASVFSAGFWPNVVRPFVEMTGAIFFTFRYPLFLLAGLCLALLFIRGIRRL